MGVFLSLNETDIIVIENNEAKKLDQWRNLFYKKLLTTKS